MSNLAEIEREIKALEASWNHWNRVVIGEDKRIKSDDCALCAEYYDITSSLTNCTICPIKLHTEKDGCYGTVYHELLRHYNLSHPEPFSGVKCDECIRLAQEMRDLIKMLWDEALEKRALILSAKNWVDSVKGWTKHYKESITPKADELWQHEDGRLWFFFNDKSGTLSVNDRVGLVYKATYNKLQHGKDGWKRVWPEVVRAKCDGDLCVTENECFNSFTDELDWLCTREKVHTGPHIACDVGYAHDLKTWED